MSALGKVVASQSIVVDLGVQVQGVILESLFFVLTKYPIVLETLFPFASLPTLWVELQGFFSDPLGLLCRSLFLDIVYPRGGHVGFV